MDIKDPTRDERIAFHIRGVKIVLMASLLGILAGVLSSPMFLSQPVYAPVIHNGGPAFEGSPTFMLAGASVLRPNASAAVPGGTYFTPDPAELLKNASLYVSNASSLMPNASLTHTNALITPGNGAITIVNNSVLLKNASVTLTGSSEVPANVSVLLTHGLIMMPGAADSQSDATVLLSGATYMQTNPHAANHSSFAFLILALAIYVQKYLLPPIGIDTSKHGVKDWFFVSFLTFCFWFITWTILLNGLIPFGPFF